jgi:hypothetical protein
MNDATTDNGNGKTPLTKGDIINQNIDKVFPEGPSVPDEEQQSTSLTLVASRPTFSVTAEELDAAKMLAMTGPFVPEFIRGNPGYAFGILQLAKRWSKYDAATNSWVSFDPIAIASQTYIVEGKGGRVSVGYTSLLIGAVLDQFVPWGRRMRYKLEGEGQTLRCTAYAYLRDDPEPFEYTTPEIRDISPKNSPLWQDDPPRQLMYYARRAWARIYSPGPILGVWDIDELTGRAHQEAHKVRDEGSISGLHERLAAAKQAAEGTPREGFQKGAAQDLPRADTERPQEAKKLATGGVIAPKPRGRVSEPPKGKAKPKPAPVKTARPTVSATAKPTVSAKPAEPPRLPTNPREYAQHVNQWLAELDTEEAIAARWRREMSLRNVCGVIEEERQAIRVLIDQRIAKLRGKK